MLARQFGHTGLQVSILGFGAGGIGGENFSEAESSRLLNGALDAGISLIDTARGYGLSEERIGRHLSHRRPEFILSTKVGYGVEGHQDWTPSCILAGVDLALSKMQTDVLDIVHLHSCPIEVLRQEEILQALELLKSQGKVRCIAYSGDNEALAWAVHFGRFDSVEASINICDQRILSGVLGDASSGGLGVVAKRPIANAPWRFAERPFGDYAEEYWLRWKAMGLDRWGVDWHEAALRFVAYCPGVHSAIVGTSRLEHLRHNASLVARGPLPEDFIKALRQAFHAADPGWWVGQT